MSSSKVELLLTGGLVQALNLSTQATTQRLKIILELSKLHFLFSQLIFQAPVLQMQLLNHGGQVCHSRSISGRLLLLLFRLVASVPLR